MDNFDTIQACKKCSLVKKRILLPTIKYCKSSIRNSHVIPTLIRSTLRVAITCRAGVVSAPASFPSSLPPLSILKTVTVSLARIERFWFLSSPWQFGELLKIAWHLRNVFFYRTSGMARGPLPLPRGESFFEILQRRDVVRLTWHFHGLDFAGLISLCVFEHFK